MDAYKISDFFGSLDNASIVASRLSKRKTMRSKSRHRDFPWTLRMLIIFYKLFGLATFAHCIVTQKKKSHQAGCVFKYSELGIAYNAVLISLMLASNYLSIPFRLYAPFTNRTNLTTSIEVAQTILGTLVICVLLLSYCVNQKLLVHIANRLTDVEHELDRFYCLYPPLRRQRIFRALIVTYIVHISLLMFLIVSEYFAFGTGPISWLSDVLPTFHVGCLMIQYFMLVTVIQVDFADVNRALRSLSGTSNLRLQSSLCQTRRVVVSNSTVHQLLQLRDMHTYLCNISDDVSSFYSLPILFGITFILLTLVYNGYYLISPLLLSDKMLQYAIFVNTIIWLICLIYPVLFLTTRITKILQEFGKTSNAVHGLLRCTIGNEAKSELEQFSLQLLHRKIQFTANGYFTLDNTLFHSMIGAMTTYLVILVQFQMGSSHSAMTKAHCNCTREGPSNARLLRQSEENVANITMCYAVSHIEN